MTHETSVTVAIVNMIVTGVGIGMFFPILTLVAQNVLPRHQLGVGTSTVTFFRSIGSVVGIAIVGTIVGHSLATQMGEKVPARAASLPAEQLGKAIVTGFEAVIVLGVLVFLLALIVENVPIAGRGERKGPPAH
jgi:MFS family permease